MQAIVFALPVDAYCSRYTCIFFDQCKNSSDRCLTIQTCKSLHRQIYQSTVTPFDICRLSLVVCKRGKHPRDSGMKLKTGATVKVQVDKTVRHLALARKCLDFSMDIRSRHFLIALLDGLMLQQSYGASTDPALILCLIQRQTKLVNLASVG